ncbi:MAG: hypothetical protein ACP5I8_16385 [Phycisphaerae bacterium]
MISKGYDPALSIGQWITTQRETLQGHVAAVVEFNATFGWIGAEQCHSLTDNSEIPHIVEGQVESAKGFRKFIHSWRDDNFSSARPVGPHNRGPQRCGIARQQCFTRRLRTAQLAARSNHQQNAEKIA